MVQPGEYTVTYQPAQHVVNKGRLEIVRWHVTQVGTTVQWYILAFLDTENQRTEKRM